MANEIPITISGNLVADPELRFTPSGAAVANFRVASTERRYDAKSGEWKDGDAVFMSCTIWRQPAENVTETLTKGMRVVVTGHLKQRSFETREGEKRTVMELEVTDIGPSLMTQTAQVARVGRTQARPAGQSAQQPSAPAAPGAAAPAAQPAPAAPAAPAAGGYAPPPF